jgi:hypothetical protein
VQITRRPRPTSGRTRLLVRTCLLLRGTPWLIVGKLCGAHDYAECSATRFET